MNCINCQFSETVRKGVQHSSFETLIFSSYNLTLDVKINSIQNSPILQNKDLQTHVIIIIMYQSNVFPDLFFFCYTSGQALHLHRLKGRRQKETISQLQLIYNINNMYSYEQLNLFTILYI